MAVRIGTWNLERGGRARLTAARQLKVIEALELDVLIATEPSPLLLATLGAVAAPAQRPGVHGPEAWVAVAGPNVEPAPVAVPYKRMAVAALVSVPTGRLLVYGSVLPWRSAPRHAPDIALPGESPSAMFERVLGDQERDIGTLRELNPNAIPIWAGDFNQSLEGTNATGSRRGRHLLEATLGRLGLEAWNRHSAHARDGASAIDLVCGPVDLKVTDVKTFGPSVDRERLSDHAGYVVDVDLP